MKTKLFALVCLLALAVGVRWAAHPSLASGGGDEFLPDEVVVGLQPGVDVTAITARYGAWVIEILPGANQYRLGLPAGSDEAGVVTAMTADRDILFAGTNNQFKPAEVRQSSAAFLDQSSAAFLDGQSPVSFFGQPALNNINVSAAQNLTPRGAGVTVAVIDTGLDFNHPLFAGRIGAAGWDFVDNDGWPNDEPGGAGYGHGTFVAGLIALIAPNATLLPLRVFDVNGKATSFNIAKAIRYAADQNAQVINLSFGLLSSDKLVDDALSYAYSKAYMVASAGNDNQNFIHYPAVNRSKTLSVTSVTNDDRKAAFANYNANLYVSAPGVNVYSAYPGNRWAWWSGTSFSTALVAGEATLCLSVNPKASRSKVNDYLTSSGLDINSLNPLYAGKLGKRVDFLGAVNRSLRDAPKPK